MNENEKKIYMLRVRMTEKERRQLHEVCGQVGEKMSATIRMLIRKAYAEIVMPSRYGRY